MRYVIKFALYLCALLIFMYVGLLQEATLNTLLIAAAVLALVNTLIRPILSLIALPFSLLTFGIASVFVNVLTIVIANAMLGGTLGSGFWIKLLLAIVIMAIDSFTQFSRHKYRARICS